MALRSVALGNATTILVARQRVEDELRAGSRALEIERRQFAEAQAMALIGSWRSDELAKTVTWSEECYRIFGMPAEECGASYEAFYSSVHPDDREGMKTAVESAIAARGTFVHDHRLLLWDGTMKWVQSRGEFVFDENGVLLTAVGTLQDITDRKASEAALQHSEQLLRIASRIGRIGGWVIDLSAAATVSWSDEVCAIHGMPPGFRPSLATAINFYAPEFRDVISRSMAECIHAGTPFDVELQIINASGQRVWVRAVGEAERDRADVITSVRGALQDISERMSALRALRDSDLRFRLIAQATSDVVWDWNLLDDLCWWSDGLQTKFGYGAAHTQSRSFWTDKVHPDDRHRVMASIRAAIDEGGVWLEEYRFRKADGTYALISDRALVTFDDEGRACRMLGAMVDVTEPRTLRARLDEAERVSSAGKMAADMAHDFNNVLMGIQPFVEVIRRVTPDIPRAQAAVARIAHSVKRGKDITDEILQLTRRVEPIAQPNHLRDWLLDFASRADALVAGDLPVDPQPVASRRETTSAEVLTSAAPPTRVLPRMVLIVDDEPAVADGISMLLASEGMTTTSILEGGQTIAAIEHHTPELVLLDIGLPDLSGVEVFKQVYDRWPTLRVVLMTGHYNRSDLSAILDLPHVGFLQKPFGADELLTAIAT